jgi:uncharacterized protein (UPF0548 family)
MFSLTKPRQEEINSLIHKASSLPLMQTEFLDLESGLKGGRAPSGYAHDRSRTQIGHGRPAFHAAVRAFDLWNEFDLGWAHVANTGAPIAPGEIVAVVAHTLVLWSVNLSQIVQVTRNSDCLAFLYKTTREHVEEGEERFVLTLAADGGVWYELEAVSRPRHMIAQLGVPFARAFQHKFGRDSHRRMRELLEAAGKS